MRPRETSSGGGPHVVVADDARELDSAELVRDAREQVLQRELLLAQRHLVRHELRARGVASSPQVLEYDFAIEQPCAELLERGAHARRARLAPRAPDRARRAPRFVRRELRGRFSEGLRIGDQFVLEPPARSRSSSALRASRVSVPRAAESLSRAPAAVILRAVTAWRCASRRSRAAATSTSAA